MNESLVEYVRMFTDRWKTAENSDHLLSMLCADTLLIARHKNDQPTTEIGRIHQAGNKVLEIFIASRLQNYAMIEVIDCLMLLYQLEIERLDRKDLSHAQHLTGRPETERPTFRFGA